MREVLNRLYGYICIHSVPWPEGLPPRAFTDEALAALSVLERLAASQREWIDRVAEISTDAATAADAAEQRAERAEAELGKALGAPGSASSRWVLLLRRAEQAEAERDEAREKLRAATNMLAAAEKIVPGTIALSGRMSLFGQSDRERLDAAEAVVAAMREALEVAQRGLRVMIRGGYIEQARSALLDSEDIARAALSQETPDCLCGFVDGYHSSWCPSRRRAALSHPVDAEATP